MKFTRKEVFTIPNMLSLVRIALMPLFIYQYFCDYKDHFYHAGITLLFSGFTDVLDGFIARHFNMVSDLGKMIDPLADKLTQGVLVVCLSINHPVLLPLLCLFFAKEFTMLLGTVRLLKMDLRPSEAKWWGKLATVVMYMLLSVTLLSDIVPEVPDVIILILAIATAITTLFSLFNYYQTFQEIQNSKEDDK